MSDSTRLEKITETVKNPLKALKESDKVQPDDYLMGAGIVCGGISLPSFFDGNTVHSAAVGFESGAFTSSAIVWGDYPQRAAAPVYHARDKARSITFDMRLADDIRETIDDNILDLRSDIDVSQELKDEYDVETVEEALSELTEDYIDLKRDEYINDPESLTNDPEAFALDLLQQRAPYFEFSDGVELQYTNEDIHPYDIKEELISRFGEFLVQELSGERKERIESSLDVVEGEHDDVEGYIDSIRDDVWDGGIDDTRDLYDAVLEDMTFQAQSIAHTRDKDFQNEVNGRSTSIDRFEEDEAVDLLDTNEYEIYEVNDPAVFATMNEELGTCKRNKDKTHVSYQEWAESDDTTILGVRREDGEEWAGLIRNYSLETADGDEVLAVDTWEMPYKEGREGRDPERACDFEEYSDVLPVAALTTIRYGLDNDYDFVVAGTGDGRVGDARAVNPGRDTKLEFTDMDEVMVTRYGLGLTDEQTVHVLMEDEFANYQS